MTAIDLSGFVTKLDIELDPWQRAMLKRLPTGTITVSFRNGRSRRAYWEAWHAYQHHRARRRQRLASMRTAYHGRHR